MCPAGEMDRHRTGSPRATWSGTHKVGKEFVDLGAQSCDTGLDTWQEAGRGAAAVQGRLRQA